MGSTPTRGTNVSLFIRTSRSYGWSLKSTMGNCTSANAKKSADLSNEKIAGKFEGYSEVWTKATFLVDSIKE